MYWIGIILLSIVIFSGINQYYKDKKKWNNGICKNTGEPWKMFDVNYQGRRGYISIGNGYTVYMRISWPVDK